MVSDEVYEICLPILQDSAIEEEDKIDKLEELLKEKTEHKGKALDNLVLDVLWRHRDSTTSTTSPPSARHAALRRAASPASWQIPRPGGPSVHSSPRLAVSPLAPPGFVPAAFNRTKSASNNSPFTSPRPSPRLNFSSPAIPHSPSLNAYELATDTGPVPEIYGDYGSDNVDWIVNDDTASVTSSPGTSAPGATSSGLNAAAAEFVQPQQNDMSPFDMLRSILGAAKSDQDIKDALSMNGYDLSAAIAQLMDTNTPENQAQTSTANTATKAVLIGKSMTPDTTRPITPAGRDRNGIVCRFWLSTGSCLRADCRFSHDLTNHICKYWVMGNCLAGNTCIFSHDPSHFMNKMSLAGSSTPPLQNATPNFQFQDYNNFPALQPPTPDQWGNTYQSSSYNYPALGFTPPAGFKHMQGYASDSSNSRSRPNSRSAREPPTAPALDDTEAFPSLGSTPAKGGKKHHGKRGGHGQGQNSPAPSSLAEVVKMSPSPGPAVLRQGEKKLGRNGSSSSIRNGENSAAAQAIPSPKHVPWLETGDKANKAYLKARSDAIKHGGLRNKFLQSAAQAWNRNDARAAKALSLRGQSENDLMRKAHREAARELYDARNKDACSNPELYVDLHGLHPEEAVEYLDRVLHEHNNSVRPIYAITGTGHHSKNGKDKVGKAIRNFLNEWRYAYREFSVPGDRNNVGGILGVDARSWDKSLPRDGFAEEDVIEKRPDATASAAEKKEEEAKPEPKPQQTPQDLLAQGHEIGEGKVRMLVRDPPKGPAAGRART